MKSYFCIKDDIIPNQFRRKALFDVTNKNEEAYLHFQLCQEVEVDLDNDSIFNSGMYECPTCCVEVPNTHAKEHIDSLKHQTHAKIIAITLERAKNNLNPSIYHRNFTFNVSRTYFCESCCLLIELENISKHEDTLIHKKKLKLDHLMTLVLQALQHTSGEESDLDQLLNELIHSDRRNYDADGNECYKKENNIDANSMIADAKATTLEYLMYSEHNKSIFSVKLVNYLEHIRTVKVNFDVQAYAGSKVKIVTNSGDAVAVPLIKFNGFNKNGKDIYCRVCQTGKFEDATTHIMSEEHIENITKPLENKHCLRKVDDVWKHCVICNELIKSDLEHIRTQMHLKNLNSHLLSEEDGRPPQPARAAAAAGAATDTCQNLDIHNYPHCDKNIVKDTENLNISGNSNMYPPNLPSINMGSTQFRSGETGERDTHNETKQEKNKTLEKKIKMICKINNMTILNAGVQCNLCGVELARGAAALAQHAAALAEHAAAAPHARRLAAARDQSHCSLVTDTRFYCQLCHIENHTKTMFTHIRSSDHKNKIANANKADFQMNTCNAGIPSASPLGGTAPQSNLIALHSSVILPKPDVISSKSDGLLSNLVLPKSAATTNEKMLPVNYCNFCNLPVEDFEIHKRNLHHKEIMKNKRNSIKELNKLIKKQNIVSRNGVLTCVACATPVELGLQPVRQHCATDKHIALKLNFEMQTLCSQVQSPSNINNLFPTFAQNTHHYSHSSAQSASLCKPTKLTVENVNNEQITRKIKEKSSLPKASSITCNSSDIPHTILYQFANIGVNNELMCKVCCELVQIARQEAQEHVNMKCHQQSYNVLMRCHRITRNDVKHTYYCEVCRVDVLHFGEIVHVYDRLHLDNLLAKPIDVNRISNILTFEFAMSLKEEKSRCNIVITGVKSPTESCALTAGASAGARAGAGRGLPLINLGVIAIFSYCIIRYIIFF